MTSYLLSLGAGVLVGIGYSPLGVRSPAPPVMALVGLAGILAGEQILPVAKWWVGSPEPNGVVHEDAARHAPAEDPNGRSRDT